MAGDFPFGNRFYNDNSEIASLSRRQGTEALDRGREAAALSDPFATERPRYKTDLATLLANPGQIESSPFYKYLRDTQMEGVKASNAARGFTNSGRGLMALQDRAAGVASQAFFPLVDRYSLLAGAHTGSPAAAGTNFARGSERSQDYGQQSLAQKLYQPPPGPAQKPWYDTPFFNNSDPMFGGKSSGLPTGGGYTPRYSDYNLPSWNESYGGGGDTYDFTGGDYGGGDYYPDEGDYSDYWSDY